MDRPRVTDRRYLKDRELEAGATAHFDDPDYYSVSYASRKEDVAMYCRVTKPYREVLEYGIGNGRIAIPLARAGKRVVGVDMSTAMLADLRARLTRSGFADRVTVRRGDMRKVKLGKRFPIAICPFNTALHLYTRQDVERWLARVREHLVPRGKLVMDVSMPILQDLADPPGTSYSQKPFRHPSAGIVKYNEVFDYDRVRQILFVSMCFEPRDGKPSFMVPLAHRQYFPRELEALLHYNGFETTQIDGDFEGGPLVQDSDVMVFHARRRGGS